MKKSLVAIIAGFVALLWMWNVRLTKPEPERALQPQAVTTPLPKRGAAARPALTREERFALLETPVQNVTQAAMLWSNAFPEEAVRFAAVLDMYNASIKFHGLCLDQNGTPLEGVKLSLSVRQWRGISPADVNGAFEDYTCVSDREGRFKVEGVKGDSIGIDSAVKTGYELLKSTNYTYKYVDSSRPRPTSRDSAAVLYFWKKQGAEPMYHFNSTFGQDPKIACDGTPEGFNIHTGARTKETPEVLFSLLRNPPVFTKQPGNKDRYDWAFTLEIPGGGILMTETNMPYMAPATGYQTKATFGFKADDPDWRHAEQRQFYFVTAKGEYGRMEAKARADYRGAQTPFDWVVYLNPSGSRNLEYDPAKRIIAPLPKPGPPK